MKILALSLVLLSPAPLLHGQAAAVDWPVIGGDSGSTRYSTLKQITTDNVTKLTQAWVYDTGDPAGGARGEESTPIVVADVMYITSGKKIIALNAETGTQVWKVDLSTLGVGGNAAKYGLSYWPGEAKTAPRLVIATSDGLLVQLDAKTGALYTKVGKNGIIDLKPGVTDKFGGGYGPGATPAIYKNLAIIAPSTGEQGRYGVEGDPRAIDLTTGKDVWTFHTVPHPGEANFGTWGPDGWQDRHGPGSWVPITVDRENGLVFVALGNATDQNYGGNRPGTNLYSCSIIALDANTGKLKWYFQATHHDTFDWDVNAPPTLVEATDKNGNRVPAVAQSTKVGLMFVLNRLTGEPVWGVEERPVPPSDAPGEVSSPTQPFPVKPEPIARISMTRDEVSKISPETYKSCLAQYDKAVNEGPDTPYLMEPSIVFPSSEGGGSWSGASYSPDLDLIFVDTRSLGTVGQEQASAGVAATADHPAMPSYAKRKIAFDDPNGYPCSQPPWGELMAVNAKTGDMAWRIPLGEYKDLTAKGIPQTGTPNVGGPVITASGVLFIGATSDRMFRAYEAKSGKLLWQTELTANATNSPLTYEGKNGKQYVSVIVTTGLSNFNHPALPSGITNKVVTFALP